MAAIRLLTTDTSEKHWHAVEEKLSNDPNFEVVGRACRLVELLLEVRSSKADVVVLFAESGEVGILSHLFAEYPDLTVLILCPSGEAFIEERCPTRREIIDSSATGIVQALRDAILQPCSGPSQRQLQ